MVYKNHSVSRYNAIVEEGGTHGAAQSGTENQNTVEEIEMENKEMMVRNDAQAAQISYLQLANFNKEAEMRKKIEVIE